jgi:hypothetical protein
VLIPDSIVAAVPRDARAVISPVISRDARRPVRLDETFRDAVPPAQWSAVERLLAESPLLAPVPEPAPDALTIGAWPHERTGTGIKWLITGADGQPAAPPTPLDEPVALLRNVHILARQSLALALENTDPYSPLVNRRPTMDLLRQMPDGTWQPAARGAGGLPVFDDGDFIGVRIVNPHDRPLYFTLLDFGLTGRVKPLYPPEGATEAIAAGGSIDLFTVPGRRCKFSIPAQYPYAPHGTLPTRDNGLETLKLFFTSAPASFDFLREADGVRSGATSNAAPTPLQLLLEHQLGATRDGAMEGDISTAALQDDWTTVLTSFVLRRRSAIPAAD